MITLDLTFLEKNDDRSTKRPICY